MARKNTLGVIVGNRGFFPAHLCREGRRAILAKLKERGIQTVALSEKDTRFGSVETWAEAKRCAELFRAHPEIDGILVTLPNFGDERAVADSIRLSGLRVPVLVHAWPDDRAKMTLENRRDSFCGKISTCGNLRQYGIPFSLTARHTLSPDDPAFDREIGRFLSVCRVVRAVGTCKIGALGARPPAFKTVRYSEKILERAGISVDTLDLSDAMAAIGRLREKDPAVARALARVSAYAPCAGVPRDTLVVMAKFKVVLDGWIAENGFSALAIQCWTSMEENLGIVPCAVMSMLSQSLVPAACEVDVLGALGMLVLQAASGEPSAIVDWNNNYGNDPDKAVFFHCSNFPVSYFDSPEMGYQDIIANTVGKEKSYGSIFGRVRKGPFTFLRLTTDDAAGTVRGYAGEGRMTDDRLETFGGYGVLEVPNLQTLMAHICANGFEHHTVINLSQTAEAVAEALSVYKGWPIHRHA